MKRCIADGSVGFPHVRVGHRQDGRPHDATRDHFRGRPHLSNDGDSHMSWIILFFAGLFEVGWAVGLKYTDGFTRPLPTILTVGAMVISLGLLGLAMKELPLGTAYAIWTGVGAVGTVIAGIILFGESMALVRLVSVALIITGLIGLKVSAS